MTGRDFLDAAQALIIGPTEAHWRGAAIHAYYALMLECRDALLRWGFTIPRRENVHAHVRLRLSYSTDADLKRLGDTLERMVPVRNKASYDLSALPLFASSVRTEAMIQDASNALALLDALETDPARLRAAKAAIQP